MARQIYSFTKIEKKRTNMGLVAMIIGIVTIAILVALIVGAFVTGGSLPFWIAGFAMLSLMGAGVGFVLVDFARKDDDTYGRFLKSGYVICAVSVGLHMAVFVIGILSIIL